MAEAYIAAHQSSWRNPIHARQWPTSLKTYVSPIIGKLPVNLITTDHVMKVLEPIWHSKTDTAKWVKGADRNGTELRDGAKATAR